MSSTTSPAAPSAAPSTPSSSPPPRTRTSSTATSGPLPPLPLLILLILFSVMQMGNYSMGPSSTGPGSPFFCVAGFELFGTLKESKKAGVPAKAQVAFDPLAPMKKRLQELLNDKVRLHLEFSLCLTPSPRWVSAPPTPPTPPLPPRRAVASPSPPLPSPPCLSRTVASPPLERR